MEDVGLVIALVLLVASLCQWLAWRMRVPAILFLLLAGLVAGPVAGLMDPDLLLGDMLMPTVSLSVAIILFEGSLTLDIREIRGVGQVVRRMITLGALVTWVVVAVATRFIFEFSWEMSALLGAIVIVTGPTVIVPMLRSVRPNRKLANILRWEGIAIDPIGALMAVVTFEFILASASEDAVGSVLWLFLQAVAAGSVLGVLSGIALGWIISRNLMPEYLHNLATLSLVLVTFTVSNAITHESGLLAVTAMGMWLANRKEVDIHPILNFKEHLSLLLISVLFILLAARIQLEELLSVGWQALLLLGVLQFVARPAKIFVSTLGQDVSWRERALLAWIAPRGIVAAAISAIFAERLLEQGYEEAGLLVPLTFTMIIGTVLLQSLTARPLARLLGVAEPSPRGFLIVGANPFSRALATALQEHDFRCVIADTNWEDLKQARMAGLETYYGNPASEHAEAHLDLSGIGGLLALSRQRHLNYVSSVHFRNDFGQQRIYAVTAPADEKASGKKKASDTYIGNRLFGDDVSYADLVSAVLRGRRVTSTTLSEEFTWEAYQNKYGEQRTPLFVIEKGGLIRPFTSDSELEPGKGAEIIALEREETRKDPSGDAAPGSGEKR
jgi:NhaP-type Na+/H+ or K+/H+ antiporter